MLFVFFSLRHKQLSCQIAELKLMILKSQIEICAIAYGMEALGHFINLLINALIYAVQTRRDASLLPISFSTLRGSKYSLRKILKNGSRYHHRETCVRSILLKHERTRLHYITVIFITLSVFHQHLLSLS